MITNTEIEISDHIASDLLESGALIESDEEGTLRLSEDHKFSHEEVMILLNPNP